MVRPRSKLWDFMSGQSGGQLQGVTEPRGMRKLDTVDVESTAPTTAFPRVKPSIGSAGSGSKPATVVPKPKPTKQLTSKGFIGAQGGGGIGTREELRQAGKFKRRSYDR